uniref:TERF1-interacting nuclear factor 2 N-terminal domain-containing protein n=1 Tax=Electrophorus electricus TaxID=8005 RepID=A0A4W4DV39_ELEEL
DSVRHVSDQSLPLSSLRLLVPPLRLMSALLWRVMQQRNVMQYGILADFVSLVSEAVPELFSHTHGVELILGLRAKECMEKCTCNLRSVCHLVMQVDSAEVGEAGLPFVELVQTLIKNTDERDHFFQHIFPVEFGPDYDSAIQTLMWDFLSRLGHFLPVPDLLQTVDWLGSESSVLKDCEESISNPDNLKSLLHHHKFLGHLDAPGR